VSDLFRNLGIGLGAESRMPSLEGATAWINSEPLELEHLKGRVVVVNFCTYTCINWLRQLPYVRAWAEQYRDHGLVVVGAHTPEFSFERDLDNIRRALAAMRVEYPIAVDSDYAIWKAFSNHYWPALYFVDANGRIRHHRFGEGDYERSEEMIKELLREAGVEGIGPELVAVEGRGAEAAADWYNLESQETYLGYARTGGFASPGGIAEDAARTYAVPDALRLHHWALAGEWMVGPEGIRLLTGGGRIAYRFHARDVNLVMGPAERGTSVPFRVLIDGREPEGATGTDVDLDGTGRLANQRMYQLLRQQGPIDDRMFEIEFLEPGAEAFVFTFG
jgi:thiol-disulfide isomerase/thioredoxin